MTAVANYFNISLRKLFDAVMSMSTIMAPPDIITGAGNAYQFQGLSTASPLYAPMTINGAR